MSSIIVTVNLKLQRFTSEDYQAVVKLNFNLEVQKYTGDKLITSLEKAKQ